MNGEKHTFICYARQDKAFARKLANDLRRNGVSIWMDVLDIPAGVRWDRAVEKALRKAERLLVILSPEAVESENVQDELALAFDRKKPIVPVRFRECEIPFRLLRLQYIDFTGDYDAALQDLLASLGVEPVTRDPNAGEIERLFGEAQAEMAKENWPAAIGSLKAVLALDASHTQAKAALQEAEQEQELADLYTRGREHFSAKRWAEAHTYFRKLLDVRGDYKNARTLLGQAEREIVKAKKRKVKKPPAGNGRKSTIWWQQGSVWIPSAIGIVTILVYVASQFQMPNEQETISGPDLAIIEAQNDSLFTYHKTAGESKLDAGDLAGARDAFEKALTYRENDKYANDKIAEIDKLFSAQRNKAVRDSLYLLRMDEGDRFFKAKDYEAAKKKYQVAEQQKGGDRQALAKIDACDRELRKKDNAFARHKKNADAFFNNYKFSEAKTEYQKAHSINSSDNHVSSQIRLCERWLADIADKQKQGMVLIPAGKFMMGSNEYDDEKPPHKVKLDAFYMDRYEVSVAQYKRFLDANPSHRKPTNWNEQLQNQKRPVVYVSWHDANEYAKWANKKLPTEAQWEYASRGGLEGKKYPWGDAADPQKANYDHDNSRSYGWENAKRYLKNIGSYAPNNYGLYDMAGNVWEWCADWYDSDYYKQFANKVAINPKGPENKTLRVLRGGSWSSNPDIMRCADRNRNYPLSRDINVGFRCVQDVTL